MEMIIRCPKGRLDLWAKRHALQGAAVVPAPPLEGGRPHADAVHGRPQTEPDQQVRSIGADLYAGADLTDAGRLLIDMDVEPGLPQVQRGRQATDTAADDGNPHASTFFHTARPSAQVLPRHGPLGDTKE